MGVLVVIHVFTFVDSSTAAVQGYTRTTNRDVASNKGFLSGKGCARSRSALKLQNTNERTDAKFVDTSESSSSVNLQAFSNISYQVFPFFILYWFVYTYTYVLPHTGICSIIVVYVLLCCNLCAASKRRPTLLRRNFEGHFVFTIVYKRSWFIFAPRQSKSVHLLLV